MSRPFPWLFLFASLVFAANSPICGDPPKSGEKNGSAMGEGRALQRHTGEVMALAFSPDGKRLASVGSDGRLLVTDTATGDVVLDRRPHPDGAFAVAFAPDGKLLATAGKGGLICLWDGTDLKSVRTIEVSKAALSALAFAPDGKALACGGYDKSISLWDPATGRWLWEATSTNRVTSLTFAPDGKSLASGGTTAIEPVAGIPKAVGDFVTLWSADTGRKLRTLAGRGSSVAFTGDGQFVLGGALVPDVRTDGGGGGVRRGGTTIDGYEVIGAWRADTGEEVMGIPWRGAGVALAPDGLLLASCQGSSRHLFPMDGGANLIRFNGENGRRTSHTLHLWDTATATAVATFPVEDARWSRSPATVGRWPPPGARAGY